MGEDGSDGKPKDVGERRRLAIGLWDGVVGESSARFWALVALLGIGSQSL